ncbi:MAG: CBS domain-containing protein [Gammaproteobacteria bacterium]|nr:CBS domain-containing protein [Gammaproteobacteria bacterium]
MIIGKICNRPVITAEKDCSVADAAKLMRQHHVGSLVVVSKNRDCLFPIGIITDRDLVIEVLAKDVPVDTVTLEDIMTRSPLISREDDDVFDTIDMMRVKGVRRIPVVDSLGSLVAIFTIDDILKIIFNEMGNWASFIYREKMQEQIRRPAPNR